MKLALGRALYYPGDPMGKMFFNILDPRHLRRIRSRSHPHACRRGYGHSPRQGKIARQAAQTVRQTAAGTLPHACQGRVFHQRSRRFPLRLKTNRLSYTQPAPFPLAYDRALYRNRPRPAGGSSSEESSCGNFYTKSSHPGNLIPLSEPRHKPAAKAPELAGRPEMGTFTLKVPSGHLLSLRPDKLERKQRANRTPEDHRRDHAKQNQRDTP